MTDEPTGLVAGLRNELRAGILPRRWQRALAGVGIILLGLVLWWLFAPGENGLDYVTVDLQRQDLTVNVSATGNLQPTRKVEIGSETSGLVTQVFVDNNDRVSAGQALARVDVARLHDSLDQAEAALASAVAQVSLSVASEAQTRAQYERLERVRKISGGQIPSDTELDQGRAEAERAIAQVRANRAAVQQAKAQVSQARTNLERATIYSPVAGVVLSRSIDPGQTVAAAFQTPVLFTIAEDLSRMRLDVRVDEADIGRVRSGQPARFRVDAFPSETFPALVERVDVGANNAETTGGGAAVAGTSSSVVSYVARLAVSNPDGRLRPGMTAVASISTQRFAGAFVVPLTALRFRPPVVSKKGGLTIRPPDEAGPSVQESRIGVGSQQTVHVLKPDGSLQAIAVTTRAISGSNAAIDGRGLRPGLRIVTGILEDER